MGKPSPIAKTTVCSECGLPWDKHMQGRKTPPTLDVCVKLLKVELTKPRPYQGSTTQIYPTITSGGFTTLGGTA